MNPPIGLLCSVPAEAEILLRGMTEMRRTNAGSKDLVQGLLGSQPVALCIGGMGKVNAAHAAMLLLTRFAPSALVVFGIGGAYPSSGAKVGDLAVADREIAGDEGVLTRDGFKDAEYIGIPLLRTASTEIYSTYPAPAALVQRTLATLRAGGSAERQVHTGPFVTLSTCTGTLARSRELEAHYRGLCENMEGAAVAHVACLHDVPWLEVRGISNIVEDRDLARWDIPAAARAAQEAVAAIVEGWDR